MDTFQTSEHPDFRHRDGSGVEGGREPVPRAGRRAAGAAPDRHPVSRSPPSTAAATPSSAASATSSTSRPTSSATATSSSAPSSATAAPARSNGRGRTAPDRRPPGRRALGGPVHGRPAGRLAVHDRGLDRRLRHLARRAPAQGRRRSARPLRRALRGPRAARGRRRTRPGPRRAQADRARGPAARPIPRCPRAPSTTSPSARSSRSPSSTSRSATATSPSISR